MALCYSGWAAGIWFNYKHTFGSFCVYTVSCENNYCCGWLIGSQSSSEADINGAAVIVTLLVMPHDSLGFRSNNRTSPNLENKIPNSLIYLCYKLVLSKPSLKSDHFESPQPGSGWQLRCVDKPESPAPLWRHRREAHLLQASVPHVGRASHSKALSIQLPFIFN